MKEKSFITIILGIMIFFAGALTYKVTVGKATRPIDEPIEIIQEQPDYIEVPQHKTGITVKENMIKPTCTSLGGYDEVIYCEDENCKQELSREHIELSIIDHQYNKGKCKICSTVDPDYNLSSFDIIRFLNDHTILTKGTFHTYLGGDNSINVFSQDKYNAISFYAASWLSFNTSNPYVLFNCEELSNQFSTLYYSICGETGYEGMVIVDIYTNGTKESGTLIDSYSIRCTDNPEKHSIDITNAKSLCICINGHDSSIVFYDFSTKEY